MVKVGADHGVIGPFLYPVVAVVTAITSVLYPLFYRSSEGVSVFLKRRSPRVVKSYVDSIGEWLAALQMSFQFNSPSAREIQRSGRILLVNLALMALLIGVGTFVLRFSEELGSFVGIKESLIGLMISAIVLALCLPSGVVVWRESRTLADLLTASAFRPRTRESHHLRTEEVRLLLRDSMLAASAVLLGVWAVPLLSQLLSLGDFSVPIPIIFLAGLAFVLARSVLKLHSALETTLERTMLGPGETPAAHGVFSDTSRRSAGTSEQSGYRGAPPPESTATAAPGDAGTYTPVSGYGIASYHAPATISMPPDPVVTSGPVKPLRPLREHKPAARTDGHDKA
jgi:hypothetical protein